MVRRDLVLLTEYVPAVIHNPIGRLSASAYRYTPDGRRNGLGDLLIRPWDRYEGANLGVVQDVRLVPIDHSNSFDYEGPIEGLSALFVEWHSDGPRYLKHNLPRAELDEIQSRVAALESDYARLNRISWFEDVVSRIEGVLGNAEDDAGPPALTLSEVIGQLEKLRDDLAERFEVPFAKNEDITPQQWREAVDDLRREFTERYDQQALVQVDRFDDLNKLLVAAYLLQTRATELLETDDAWPGLMDAYLDVLRLRLADLAAGGRYPVPNNETDAEWEARFDREIQRTEAEQAQAEFAELLGAPPALLDEQEMVWHAMELAQAEWRSMNAEARDRAIGHGTLGRIGEWIAQRLGYDHDLREALARGITPEERERFYVRLRNLEDWLHSMLQLETSNAQWHAPSNEDPLAELRDIDARTRASDSAPNHVSRLVELAERFLDMNSGRHLGADPLLDIVRAVNPLAPRAADNGADSAYNNCADCAVVTDRNIDGHNYVASPLETWAGIYFEDGQFRSPFIDAHYATTFQPVTSLAELETELLGGGHLARGMVAFRTTDGGNHVLNVVNEHGFIRYLDGQVGRDATTEMRSTITTLADSARSGEPHGVYFLRTDGQFTGFAAGTRGMAKDLDAARAGDLTGAQLPQPGEPSASNPILTADQNVDAYGMVRWDLLESEHIIPAMETAVAEYKSEIAAIIADPAPPTIANTLDRFAAAGKLLNRVVLTVAVIADNHKDPERFPGIDEIIPTIRSMRSDLIREIFTNRAFFERVKTLHEQIDELALAPATKEHLQRLYQDFRRTGIDLPPEKQQLLKELDDKIADLIGAYNKNMLEAYRDAAIHVTDHDDLSGMSAAQIEAARLAAEMRGLAGYVIELTPTSSGNNQPLLDVLDNRELRERLYRASTEIGRREAHNNSEIGLEVVRLRAVRAEVLGYPNHAEFVAEEEPVSPQQWLALLDELIPPVVAAAREELERGAELLGMERLEPWDVPYATTKAQEALDATVDTTARPADDARNHPKLDRTLESSLQFVHFVAENPLELTYTERFDIPVFHPDIRTFDVTAKDGRKAGLVLLDPFARPTKRGGAWTHVLVDKFVPTGQLPVCIVTLNIPKPPPGKPAALTESEHKTLFHEHGHSFNIIHGSGANELLGMRMPRSWAEFPALVTEMFASDPAALRRYAEQNVTGTTIPEDVAAVAPASRQPTKGIATARNLAYTVLDLMWYQSRPDELPSGADLQRKIRELEVAVLAERGLDLPYVTDSHTLQHYGHIIGSNYGGVMHAYLVAEILAKISATTVERLIDRHGLSHEAGHWLIDNVLGRNETGLREFVGSLLGHSPDVGGFLEERGIPVERPAAASTPASSPGIAVDQQGSAQRRILIPSIEASTPRNGGSPGPTPGPHLAFQPVADLNPLAPERKPHKRHRQVLGGLGLNPAILNHTHPDGGGQDWGSPSFDHHAPAPAGRDQAEPSATHPPSTPWAAEPSRRTEPGASDLAPQASADQRPEARIRWTDSGWEVTTDNPAPRRAETEQPVDQQLHALERERDELINALGLVAGPGLELPMVPIREAIAAIATRIAAVRADVAARLGVTSEQVEHITLDRRIWALRQIESTLYSLRQHETALSRLSEVLDQHRALAEAAGIRDDRAELAVPFDDFDRSRGEVMLDFDLVEPRIESLARERDALAAGLNIDQSRQLTPNAAELAAIRSGTERDWVDLAADMHVDPAVLADLPLDIFGDPARLADDPLQPLAERFWLADKQRGDILRRAADVIRLGTVLAEHQQATRVLDDEVARRAQQLFPSQPGQWITDHVKYQPAVDGRSAQLWIVAMSGRHRRALLEAVAVRGGEYPELTRALTPESPFDIFHAHVGPSSQGSAYLISTERVGPERPLDAAEMSSTFLLMYLTYRSANLLPGAPGFDTWMKPVGAITPATKVGDIAARLTAAGGRASGETVALVRDSATVADELFSSREVARRFLNREISASTQWREPLAGRPRAETRQEIKVGRLKIDIPMAPDGRGGVEVAQPEGGFGTDVVIARYFDGWHAANPKQLANKIKDALLDGSVTLSPGVAPGAESARAESFDDWQQRFADELERASAWIPSGTPRVDIVDLWNRLYDEQEVFERHGHRAWFTQIRAHLAQLAREAPFDGTFVPESEHAPDPAVGNHATADPSVAVSNSPWRALATDSDASEPTDRPDHVDAEDTGAQPVSLPEGPSTDAPEPLADSSNPLIAADQNVDAYGMVRWDLLESEHLIPAMRTAVAEFLAEIDEISNDREPANIANTLDRFAAAGKLLDRVVNAVHVIASNLKDPERFPGIDEIIPKISAMGSGLRSDIFTNKSFFERVKTLHEQHQRGELDLDAATAEHLERLYQDFRRTGIDLPPGKQELLKAIDKRIAELINEYDSNVSAATRAAALYVTDLDSLSGMSQTQIDNAKSAAVKRGFTDGYVIELTPADSGNYQPLITTLDDRALRERLERAATEIGRGGPHDNTHIAVEVMLLRAERANLLGYPDHATFATEDEPVSPQQWFALLSKLLPSIVAAAKEELAEGAELLGLERLESWDAPYARRLVLANVDAEIAQISNKAQDYLILHQVLEDGFFAFAKEFFGLTFTERPDIPTFHPDVRSYEVTDERRNKLGLILHDPFARPGKRGGASTQGIINKFVPTGQLPVCVVTTHFVKPEAGEPEKLIPDNVVTIFHEFGHGVNITVGDGVRELLGSHKPRSWAEFPAQVMEMFWSRPEVIGKYARHYETGEPMPPQMIEALLATKQSRRGVGTARNFAYTRLDLLWHMSTPHGLPPAATELRALVRSPEDIPVGTDLEALVRNLVNIPPGTDLATLVRDLEDAELARHGLDLPYVLDSHPLQHFGHIIGSSYGGVMYAYPVAEILAKIVARTTEQRIEQDGFTRAVGDWMRETIFRHEEIGLRSIVEGYLGDDPNVGPYLESRGIAVDRPAGGGRPATSSAPGPGVGYRPDAEFNPLAPERHRLVGKPYRLSGADGRDPAVFNRFNEFPDPRQHSDDRQSNRATLGDHPRQADSRPRIESFRAELLATLDASATPDPEQTLAATTAEQMVEAIGSLTPRERRALRILRSGQFIPTAARETIRDEGIRAASQLVDVLADAQIEADPRRAAIAAANVRQLQDAIARLGTQQRQIVVGLLERGESPATMARRLGLPEPTIEFMLSGAVRRMAGYLVESVAVTGARVPISTQSPTETGPAMPANETAFQRGQRLAREEHQARINADPEPATDQLGNVLRRLEELFPTRPQGTDVAGPENPTPRTSATSRTPGPTRHPWNAPDHPGVMKPPGGFDPGRVTAFDPTSDGADHAHGRRQAHRPTTGTPPTTSRAAASDDAVRGSSPNREALQVRKALADAVGVEPDEVTHGRVREALRTVTMELRLFDDADWTRALATGDLPGIRGWFGELIALHHTIAESTVRGNNPGTVADRTRAVEALNRELATMLGLRELRQEPVADWGNDELSELRSIHERTGETEQFEQFLEALEGFLAVDPAQFVVQTDPGLPVGLSGVDRSRPVTQRTIATLTGKSQSTVSLAVRGLPGPSAADAALIRRVASELGYPLSEPRAAQTTGDAASTTTFDRQQPWLGFHHPQDRPHDGWNDTSGVPAARSASESAPTEPPVAPTQASEADDATPTVFADDLALDERPVGQAVVRLLEIRQDSSAEEVREQVRDLVGDLFDGGTNWPDMRDDMLLLLIDEIANNVRNQPLAEGVVVVTWLSNAGDGEAVAIEGHVYGANGAPVFLGSMYEHARQAFAEFGIEGRAGSVDGTTRRARRVIERLALAEALFLSAYTQSPRLWAQSRPNLAPIYGHAHGIEYRPDGAGYTAWVVFGDGSNTADDLVAALTDREVPELGPSTNPVADQVAEGLRDELVTAARRGAGQLVTALTGSHSDVSVRMIEAEPHQILLLATEPWQDEPLPAGRPGYAEDDDASGPVYHDDPDRPRPTSARVSLEDPDLVERLAATIEGAAPGWPAITRSEVAGIVQEVVAHAPASTRVMVSADPRGELGLRVTVEYRTRSDTPPELVAALEHGTTSWSIDADASHRRVVADFRRIDHSLVTAATRAVADDPVVDSRTSEVLPQRRSVLNAREVARDLLSGHGGHHDAVEVMNLAQNLVQNAVYSWQENTVFTAEITRSGLVHMAISRDHADVGRVIQHEVMYRTSEAPPPEIHLTHDADIQAVTAEIQRTVRDAMTQHGWTDPAEIEAAETVLAHQFSNFSARAGNDGPWQLAVEVSGAAGSKVLTLTAKGPHRTERIDELFQRTAGWAPQSPAALAFYGNSWLVRLHLSAGGDPIANASDLFDGSDSFAQAERLFTAADDSLEFAYFVDQVFDSVPSDLIRHDARAMAMSVTDGLVENLVADRGGEVLLTAMVTMGSHGLEFRVALADRHPTVDASELTGELWAEIQPTRSGAESWGGGTITWAALDLRPDAPGAIDRDADGAEEMPAQTGAGRSHPATADVVDVGVDTTEPRRGATPAEGAEPSNDHSEPSGAATTTPPRSDAEPPPSEGRAGLKPQPQTLTLFDGDDVFARIRSVLDTAAPSWTGDRRDAVAATMAVVAADALMVSTEAGIRTTAHPLPGDGLQLIVEHTGDNKLAPEVARALDERASAWRAEMPRRRRRIVAEFQHTDDVYQRTRERARWEARFAPYFHTVDEDAHYRQFDIDQSMEPVSAAGQLVRDFMHEHGQGTERDIRDLAALAESIVQMTVDAWRSDRTFSVQISRSGVLSLTILYDRGVGYGPGVEYEIVFRPSTWPSTEVSVVAPAPVETAGAHRQTDDASPAKSGPYAGPDAHVRAVHRFPAGTDADQAYDRVLELVDRAFDGISADAVRADARPAAALLALEIVHNLVVAPGSEALLTGQVALGEHGLEFHVTVADRQPVSATEGGWRVQDLVVRDQATRAGVELRDGGKITWAAMDLRPGAGGRDFDTKGPDDAADPSAESTGTPRTSGADASPSAPATPWTQQRPAVTPSPWRRSSNETTNPERTTRTSPSRNDSISGRSAAGKGAMPPGEAEIAAALGIDERRARVSADSAVHTYRRNPWVLNRFGPGDAGANESPASGPQSERDTGTPASDEQGIRIGKIEVHPRAAEFDEVAVDPEIYIKGIADVLDFQSVHFDWQGHVRDSDLLPYTTGPEGDYFFITAEEIRTSPAPSRHPMLYSTYREPGHNPIILGHWHISGGRDLSVSFASYLLRTRSAMVKNSAYGRYLLAYHRDLSTVQISDLTEGALWRKQKPVGIPTVAELIARGGQKAGPTTFGAHGMFLGGVDDFWVDIVDLDSAPGRLSITFSVNMVLGESENITLVLTHDNGMDTAAYTRDIRPGEAPRPVDVAIEKFHDIAIAPWLTSSQAHHSERGVDRVTTGTSPESTPAQHNAPTAETPALLERPSQAEDPTRPLRVATWNIAGGRRLRHPAEGEDGNEAIPFDYDAIDVEYFADRLRDIDPDVVAIQESEAGVDGSTAQQLAALLGYPYVYETVMSQSHMDDSKMLSVAVISRLPIDAATAHQLPVTRLELRIGEQPVAPHDRFAQVVEIAGISVVNLHPTPLGFFGYSYEEGDGAAHAEEIAQTLRAMATGPVVIAADLNTDRPHTVYQRTFDEIGLSPVLAPDARTVPGWDGAPDQVVASQDFTAADSGIAQTETDHWLVYSDLAINDQRLADSLAATRLNEAPPPPQARIEISVHAGSSRSFDVSRAGDVVGGMFAGSPFQPHTATVVELVGELLDSAEGAAVVRVSRSGQPDNAWMSIEVVDRPVDESNRVAGDIRPGATGHRLELPDQRSPITVLEQHRNGERIRYLTLTAPAFADQPLTPPARAPREVPAYAQQRIDTVGWQTDAMPLRDHVTDAGTSIPARSLAEGTANAPEPQWVYESVEGLIELFVIGHDNGTRYEDFEPCGPINPFYNCHGATFTADGRGGWLAGVSIDTILAENGFYAIADSEARPEDVVVYRNDQGVVTHSGVVEAIIPEGIRVRSKLGALSTDVHFKDEVSVVYGENVTIYRTDRAGGRYMTPAADTDIPPDPWPPVREDPDPANTAESAPSRVTGRTYPIGTAGVPNTDVPLDGRGRRSWDRGPAPRRGQRAVERLAEFDHDGGGASRGHDPTARPDAAKAEPGAPPSTPDHGRRGTGSEQVARQPEDAQRPSISGSGHDSTDIEAALVRYPGFGYIADRPANDPGEPTGAEFFNTAHQMAWELDWLAVNGARLGALGAFALAALEAEKLLGMPNTGPGPLLIVQDRPRAPGEILPTWKMTTLQPGSPDRPSVIGEVARALSLDEIPQYAYISLVGARPLLTRDIALTMTVLSAAEKERFAPIPRDGVYTLQYPGCRMYANGTEDYLRTRYYADVLLPEIASRTFYGYLMDDVVAPFQVRAAAELVEGYAHRELSAAEQVGRWFAATASNMLAAPSDSAPQILRQALDAGIHDTPRNSVENRTLRRFAATVSELLAGHSDLGSYLHHRALPEYQQYIDHVKETVRHRHPNGTAHVPFIESITSAPTEPVEPPPRPVVELDAIVENPVFASALEPHTDPAFDRMKAEHFPPVFEYAIQQQWNAIETIAANRGPWTAENTLRPFAESGRALGAVKQLFSEKAAVDRDEATAQFEPMIADMQQAHQNRVLTDPALAAIFKHVYEHRGELGLTERERGYVEWKYQDFVRAGAYLTSDQDRRELAEINSALPKLRTEYKDNQQKAIEAFEFRVDTVEQLDGLNDDQIAAARDRAGESAGYLLPKPPAASGVWYPYLSYLNDPELSRRLYEAVSSLAIGGAYDNSANVIAQAEMAARRAQLTGYAHHADYVTAGGIFESVEEIQAILGQIASAASDAARIELPRLAQAIGAAEIHPWTRFRAIDVALGTMIGLDEQQMREYFVLDRVLVDGVFHLANLLLDLSFTELSGDSKPPVWHEDVRVFAVTDANGKHITKVYFDPYAREGKNSGEWTDPIRLNFTGQNPLIGVHLNLVKPPPGTPTLLTPHEVKALFHEFGHELHFSLGEGTFEAANRHIVFGWLEFVAKMFEQFWQHPEVLARFAVHHENPDRRMPPEMLARFEEWRTAYRGTATIFRLSGAYIDLAWSTLTPDQVPHGSDAVALVKDFDMAALVRAGIYFPEIGHLYPSQWFRHLYGDMGGFGVYSGQYSSYLISDVFAPIAFRRQIEPVIAAHGLGREVGNVFRELVFGPEENNLAHAVRRLIGTTFSVDMFLADQRLLWTRALAKLGPGATPDWLTTPTARPPDTDLAGWWNTQLNADEQAAMIQAFPDEVLAMDISHSQDTVEAATSRQQTLREYARQAQRTSPLPGARAGDEPQTRADSTELARPGRRDLDAEDIAILTLLADGHSLAEIRAQHYMSRSTLRSRLDAIAAKLGTDSTMGSVVRAWQQELLHVGERDVVSPSAGYFTSDEVETLTLLARGMSNAQVAEHLRVSRSTVQDRLARVFDKLGVHGRIPAVLAALDRRVISIESADAQPGSVARPHSGAPADTRSTPDVVPPPVMTARPEMPGEPTPLPPGRGAQLPIIGVDLSTGHDIEIDPNDVRTVTLRNEHGHDDVVFLPSSHDRDDAFAHWASRPYRDFEHIYTAYQLPGGPPFRYAIASPEPAVWQRELRATGKAPFIVITHATADFYSLQVRVGDAWQDVFVGGEEYARVLTNNAQFINLLAQDEYRPLIIGSCSPAQNGSSTAQFTAEYLINEAEMDRNIHLAKSVMMFSTTGDTARLAVEAMITRNGAHLPLFDSWWGSPWAFEYRPDR